MNVRAWIALVAGVFAIGLLGAPAAAARPSRTPSAGEVSATGARLFWYLPAIETHGLPQRINAVAFDPATPGLALASEGNSGGVILRSRDHGLTWAPLPAWDALFHESVAYHVIYGEAPQTFYAFGAIRIYKTTDGGDTWAAIPYRTTCNQIMALAIHPTIPTLLYVGTTNGFARSLDGGQTWTSRDDINQNCAGPPYAFALGIGVDQPNVVYAGEPYNYGGGAYRSTDQGTTWQPITNGLPLTSGGYRETIVQVVADPRNAAIAYALSGAGQIFKTTNSGDLWKLLDQGIPNIAVNALTLVPSQNYRLYTATPSQIYTLADGAQTWQPLDADPIPQNPAFPHPTGLQIDPALARPLAFDDRGLFVGLPTPAISALSPAAAPVGTRDFTLTVDGSDFTAAALVRWNGQERPTTFVSDTRLTATISATDVLTTGVVPISVGYHRYAGNGVSNALPFTIQPACAVDGQALPNDQCAATVTPNLGATLVYSSSASLITTIHVPAGSVGATTVLSYTGVPTATAPAGFGFAGLAFALDAYRGGVRQDGFAFTQAITVSVQYGDADVAGLNEQTLTLDYWNGTAWVDARDHLRPAVGLHTQAGDQPICGRDLPSQRVWHVWRPAAQAVIAARTPING